MGPSPPAAVPGRGVPALSVTADDIAAAADRLASGTGPFAVDAERASGFRYSNRAYLIQIRRTGAGTVLIDPVNHGGSPIDALAPVAEVLAEDEWILHAADQDLPCLAEVGLRPPALYDTELAGRLAGFEQVNLAAMVQRLLGLGLAKGHGAADWSKRPLPDAWLNYAALDVEVLVELRHAIADILAEQDKTGWATEEFSICAAPRRPDAARPLAAHLGHPQGPQARGAGRGARTVDGARPDRPQPRHRAGRILPDSAIVAAAMADPKTVEELTAADLRRAQTSQRQGVAGRARAARTNPDPPDTAEPQNGPPPAARWSKRKPEAAARLEAPARRWPRSPRG